jgi:hypothetical protein
MIYIDTSTFTPNKNWVNKADTLYLTLLSLKNIEEKLAFIKANESFWGEIKNELPFCDKCWISEAKESVSPYTIEHFRPKSSVTRVGLKVLKDADINRFVEQARRDWLTSRPKNKGLGYWWLAFNYRNFRICGSRINNTKGTRFPLFHGSKVCYTENQDITEEQVVLLDPTNEEDPKLITFDPDGSVNPASDLDENNFHRSLVSITIYGLNAIPPLVEHRKTKWEDCLNLIKDINSYYPVIEPFIYSDVESVLPPHIQTQLGRFNSKIEQLRSYISPESEFSAVAKTCLLSYKMVYNWINDYVLDT